MLSDCRRQHDAVGGWCSRCPSRRCGCWLTDQYFHRLTGSATDDPEHVPPSRRADAHSVSRVGSNRLEARTLHLQRSLGRDGVPSDRLRDGVVRVCTGGYGSRNGVARLDAQVQNPIPALLRRLPHICRDVEDRCKSSRHLPLLSSAVMFV